MLPTYDEKIYGIVIIRPGNDRRLFGRVRRSPKGDVDAIWAEDESPDSLSQGSNPHASYHNDGRLHSKTYDMPTVVKKLQPPGQQFSGNQPIEATNADRGESATLPSVPHNLDGVFEVPLDAVEGYPNRSFTADVVEPGVEPIRLTGKDTVISEKVFRDNVPWIVASLVEMQLFS